MGSWLFEEPKIDKSRAYSDAMRALEVGDVVMARSAAWAFEWRRVVITGRTEQGDLLVGDVTFHKWNGTELAKGKFTGSRSLVPMTIWDSGIWRPPVETCSDCGAHKGARIHLPRCAPCAEKHKTQAIALSVARTRERRAAAAAAWEAGRPAREAEAKARAEADRVRREAEAQLAAERETRKALLAKEKRREGWDKWRENRGQPRRYFTDGFRSGDLLVIGPRLGEVLKVTADGVWVATTVETTCYDPEYLGSIAFPVTPATLRRINLLPPSDLGIRGFTYAEVNAIASGVPFEAVRAAAWKRPFFHAPFAKAVDLECAMRDRICGRIPAKLSESTDPATDQPPLIH